MKRKVLIFGFVFLVFSAFIGLNFLFIQSNEEVVLVDRLKETLKQNEQNLNSAKASLLQHELFHEKDLCFDCLRKEFENNKHIDLFYYQDSMLLYWSSNYALPNILVSEIFGEENHGYVTLYDGIYQFLTFSIEHSNTLNEKWSVLLTPIYKSYTLNNQFLNPHLVEDIFDENISVGIDLEEPIIYGWSLNAIDFIIDKKFSISNMQAFGLFFVSLLAYISLIILAFSAIDSFFKLVKSGFKFILGSLLLLFGSYFYYLLIRYSILLDSQLFGVDYITFFFIEISIGEAIFWIVQLLLFTRIFTEFRPQTTKPVPQLVSAILLAILYLIFFYAFYFLIAQIIFESQIPLSFHEFYELNIQSFIILLLISLLAVIFYTIVKHLFVVTLPQRSQFWLPFLIIILSIGIYHIVFGNQKHTAWINDIFALLLFVIFLLNRKHEISGKYNLRLLSFVLLSFILTWLFYTENLRKSQNEQELVAMQLNVESDPMFEFVFNSVFREIEQDTILNELIYRHDFEELALDTIQQYVAAHYNHEYFSKYNVSITLCDNWDELLIQPGDYVTNCKNYFTSLSEQSGLVSDQNPNLFYIQDNLIGAYYLAILPLKPDEFGQRFYLFIEYYFKYFPEGLGYPELLVERENSLTPLFSDYSFATYSNGKLVYKFGKYIYPLEIDQITFAHGDFVKTNGFRHYFLEVSPGSGLVVSKPAKRLIDIIAPFSYFIIVLSILSLLFNKQMLQHPISYIKTINFRSKLQIFNLSALVTSFIVIGLLSSFYIRDIYRQKSDDFLSERTQSILIELEHKLQNDDIISPEIRDYLHQILTKFSQVFFSDINLYNLEGDLLASSRPEIFQRQLISEKMNPEAYAALRSGKSYLFLHQEQIGQGSYYSSYVPFQNADGETIAFVNLPYFARESELRTEISTFVLTYMNIFILLSGISAFVVLYLSGRLTKPLLLLQSKMKAIRFDQANEPIEWHSQDEIGQLVNQYNQLIMELERSAELLARSERETAWREMARQVAHEIKNPLTPMRLSVQHLKRSWDDHDPEIEQKIERTTKTLIEQIDTLSTIASAFSDFARMPVNKPEAFDLADLIKRTALLYSGKSNISIDIQTESDSVFWVYADKKNIGRAFGNLFKNAVQAIGNKPEGEISIVLLRTESVVKVTVKDNGKGMTQEEQNKLFTPNFTTKSSGMGLGLSIVRQIIESAGGSITFTSKIGSGTSFDIELPLVKA